METTNNKNKIASVLIYGDLHLSSKNYGNHIDYPSNTLRVLETITEYCKKYSVTHLIGLGDLSFGRFNNLEYRYKIEQQFIEQNQITSNNHYELKGNHDKASYGMTEYEYYTKTSMLKPATNFDIGDCFHFTLVNYGEEENTPTNIHRDGGINFLLAHNYLRFKDSNLPNYGNSSIELDNYSRWFGVNHIVCGHIHNSHLLQGVMTESETSTSGIRLSLDYLGSMSRPSYHGEQTPTKGYILLLNLYDNGEYEYNRIEISLPAVEDTFQVASVDLKNTRKAERQKRLELSDIVSSLDSHERNIGNPEDIINSLQGVEQKYKNKAIELLREAMR